MIGIEKDFLTELEGSLYFPCSLFLYCSIRVWDVMQGCGNWCKVGGDGFTFCGLRCRLRKGLGELVRAMDYCRTSLEPNFLAFVGKLHRGFSSFTLFNKKR